MGVDIETCETCDETFIGDQGGEVTVIGENGGQWIICNDCLENIEHMFINHDEFKREYKLKEGYKVVRKEKIITQTFYNVESVGK